MSSGAIMGAGDGPVGGYNPRGRSYTNPQTLANLLVVFERKSIAEIDNDGSNPPRNAETYKKSIGELDETGEWSLERDATIAIGIAAGYINLTAALLGYSTGCCQCMDVNGIKNLLGLKNNPYLLMGIGFKNEKMNRKIHHAIPEVTFGSFKKQNMDVTFVN